MLKIENIPALYGDCFLIQSEDRSINFLVDCGFKKTYTDEIIARTRLVDFVILTHVDEDHILGAIPLVQDHPDKFQVNKIFINTPKSCWVSKSSGDISIGQGITLEKLIADKEISYGSLIQGEKLSLSDDCVVKIISPSQSDIDYFNEKFVREFDKQTIDTPISVNVFDDSSFEVLSQRKDSFKSKKADFINASSIAFILEYKQFRVLFLGDAHPQVISEYLKELGYSSNNKCSFDYVKLAHHGSITSISNELISLISCSKFIVSTNGGKAKSKHPSRETIAKLSVNVDRNGDKEINFFFNYPIKEYEVRNGILATSEEVDKYNINFEHLNELILQ